MPDDSPAPPDQAGDSPAQAIGDSVRRFVAQRSSFRRIRDRRGQPPGYSRDIWRAMADAGWFDVLLAEDDGGIGLRLAEAAAIAGGLASGLFPEPFTGAAILPLLLLSASDNPDLRDELIPAILAGETLAAVAWQEDANGIDPRHRATRVAVEGGSAILTGARRLINGAARADGFIVSASGPEGVELWWVPRDADGIMLSLERLADGTFGGTVTPKSVRVPIRHRISAGADTLARAVLSDAIEVADRASPTARVVDGDATARAAAASRANARRGDAAILVARERIQMFGAMGFTDEPDLSLCVKRILVLSAWLGPAHHHRRRFAALCPPRSDAADKRGDQRPPAIPTARHRLEQPVA